MQMTMNNTTTSVGLGYRKPNGYPRVELGHSSTISHWEKNNMVFSWNCVDKWRMKHEGYIFWQCSCLKLKKNFLQFLPWTWVIYRVQATKFCFIRITGFHYSYFIVRVTTDDLFAPLFHWTNWNISLLYLMRLISHTYTCQHTCNYFDVCKIACITSVHLFSGTLEWRKFKKVQKHQIE